jgi:hypothetical protein
MTKGRMLFLLAMVAILASYAGTFCFRPGGLSDGGFW